MITKHLPGNSTSDRMVERVFKGRELWRAQPATPGPRRQAIGDFICISQSLGSGGSEVAALLGEKLGWPVLDRQVLHAMAGDDYAREQLYRALDEHDLGWFTEACRALMDNAFRKNDYFHRLVQTVVYMARQGPAVFVGRGTDLILPQDRGVRARIVAPLQQRIACVARENDLTEREAAEAITSKERDRAEWVRNHFHITADDPSRYDLVLNLGRLSAAQAAELILAAHNMRAAEKSAAGKR